MKKVINTLLFLCILFPNIAFADSSTESSDYGTVTAEADIWRVR